MPLIGSTRSLAAPSAVAMALMTSFWLGTGVSAQEPTPPITEPTPAAVTTGSTQPAGELDRIIVTGSNIPTAEEVGPNPVLTINRDFIEKSGERTAEQLLRDIPVANANGVPTNGNGTGNTPGASSVSLRGFSPGATLVLLDGRRVAPYPQGAGATGTQTFIDLNSIPGAAIESIEILKDGASTTYGADAIAGVVNIKFRRNYRGAESTVEVGNTLDKDNTEFSASLLFGVGDEKTSVSGVINYYHRNAIFTRDRGFSNFTFSLSLNTSPGQFEVSRAAALAAGVPPSRLPASGRNFFARPPFFTNGDAPSTSYSFFRRPVRDFNYNQFAGSFPESERYGGFLNAEHKICGEQLVLYADFSYQNVRTRNELAPSPTSAFNSPGETVLAIPPHAPGATVGGPSYASTGVAMGAFNPFNPFQQIISGRSRYRLADFPERVRISETDAFMSTVGLKGDKLFGGSWGYDGGFRYSEIKDTETSVFASRSRLNRIFNAADPIFDPSSSQFIGTTIPYNPFGDYRRPVATNVSSADYATVHPKDLFYSKLATLDFTMYTTSLFKLPAGGVGLAFGGQFRRESIAQDPDQLFQSGDILGGSQENATVAGRKSFGIYGEGSIPIFSPEMKVTGFRALEFTAAARFEYFLNNDTNIVVPKIGVRWQPFDDTLTLRATWGEGFREPSLFELFSSPQTFGAFVHNPITDEDESEVSSTLRSNRTLAPEDSRQFSAGFVYTPRFVEGLNLSVDVFGIERHDVVGDPGPQAVLDRDARGTLLPGESVTHNDDGSIAQIMYPYENNGGERARGFDIGLQYQRQTSFGTFTSLTQVTYIDSFRIAFVQGGPSIETSGGGTPASGSQDALVKWKGRTRLDWAWKGFDLSTTCTYTDGFHEILDGGPSFPDNKKEHWVHQTFVFDVQGSYEFTFAPPVETQPVAGYSKGVREVTRGKDGSVTEAANAQSANASLPCWKSLVNNTKLTVGCNNVFGQDPPQAYVTGDAYPQFLYDPVGRFVYVSLKKKF